jgi:HD superfamily phosphohydrolase
MGLSYLVYPGAHHTRFHHVLGCGFLMQKAIDTLRFKGVDISSEEEEALNIAILLHDMGHGPFSHALEHSLVKGIGHEDISIKFMEKLNIEFEGKLEMAIEIFKGRYPRRFMNQLISGQLDMDRLDYLKRDSFYSGVAEGNINVDRLITMLDVKDNELVLEFKGIYSAEKFLMARRFMYWQVYLHKTGIVAEKVLGKIVSRARILMQSGALLKCSEPLGLFLKNDIEQETFDDNMLSAFAKIDDFDVMMAIKNWMNHDDFILAYLCRSVVDRKLPKIEMQNVPFDPAYVKEVHDRIGQKLDVNSRDLGFLVYSGSVDNKAYDPSAERIMVLYKNGELKDIASASDSSSIQALSKPVEKYFLCYPKN